MLHFTQTLGVECTLTSSFLTWHHHPTWMTYSYSELPSNIATHYEEKHTHTHTHTHTHIQHTHIDKYIHTSTSNHIHTNTHTHTHTHTHTQRHSPLYMC